MYILYKTYFFKKKFFLVLYKKNLVLQQMNNHIQGLRQFLANESPLKVMKNVLSFTLKALLSSRYLIFRHHVLVMQKNDLIRKIRLISKFMMWQAGKQNCNTHIVQNCKKENQTTKFGQLIEYSKKNISLVKCYRKCDGDTIARPFCKENQS